MTGSPVRRIGDTVTPSTPALLYEDHLAGTLAQDDRACFSVVGSGAERGAFIAPVHLSRAGARA